MRDSSADPRSEIPLSSSEKAEVPIPRRSPELIIQRAIRQFKRRRLARDIRQNDRWVFEVALRGQLSQHRWPVLMHAPATLERLSRFLEDFGARCSVSLAHARIVMLSLLLAGLRPAHELVFLHRQAYYLARLCEHPESSTDRAMFIALYPKTCHYILEEFNGVLAEIRSASALYLALDPQRTSTLPVPAAMHVERIEPAEKAPIRGIASSLIPKDAEEGPCSKTAKSPTRRCRGQESRRRIVWVGRVNIIAYAIVYYALRLIVRLI